MQRLGDRIVFGIILLTVFFGSCDPNGSAIPPDGKVKLNFRAVFDTTAVIMGNQDRLFNHMGDDLYFEEFKFFISDVALKSENGTTLGTIVEEGAVELINLTDRDNPERARAGKSLFKPVRVGKYSGIQLDFGVPAESNRTVFTQGEFKSENDLSDREMHSNALESYIFLGLKGFIPGIGDFSYEIGTDELFMPAKFYEQTSIVADENDDIEFNFVIDLKKVLKEIKISNNRRITDENLMDLGIKVMDNLVSEGLELKED